MDFFHLFPQIKLNVIIFNLPIFTATIFSLLLFYELANCQLSNLKWHLAVRNRLVLGWESHLTDVCVSVCVCVCLSLAVTLISVSIVIPCLVRWVNANNRVLPIILVGYHTQTHTHTQLLSLYERKMPGHIFNKHHLTTRISNRVGAMDSMNPNALVISSSTVHQLPSSMSSLCFSCPLTARLHSRWRFTSWSRACCAGTSSDWPAHLRPRRLNHDWQVPSPNRGPAAADILLLSDSPNSAGLPAGDSGHDIISFSLSNSCSWFLLFIKSGDWFSRV